MSVDWNYYDKFEGVLRMYLPDRGEGDTLASQCVTAINKLVYKWYNDGDVFDNNYLLEGWANDLSSYANWLYKYIPRASYILDDIQDCNENEYSYLLKSLADTFLDEEFLADISNMPAEGSIYDCDGPYSFSLYQDDEDDYYDDEDDYYDDEDDDDTW